MQSEEKPAMDLATMEPQDGEILPISGKSFHGVILSKSHVPPACIMVLPVKFQSVLPAIVIPAVLYCGGKKWNIDYCGNRRSKTFDIRQWRKFVNDNRLKLGDACVFELMECCSTSLTFRVQILRGDIPFQLHDKFSGDTVDTPILVD